MVVFHLSNRHQRFNFIYSGGRHKQPTLKINFWYRPTKTAGTNNRLHFLCQLTMSLGTTPIIFSTDYSYQLTSIKIMSLGTTLIIFSTNYSYQPTSIEIRRCYQKSFLLVSLSVIQVMWFGCICGRRNTCGFQKECVDVWDGMAFLTTLSECRLLPTRM
jgi:hypothetical protein